MDIKRTGVKARKRRRQLWIGGAVVAGVALLAVVVLGLEPPTPTHCRQIYTRFINYWSIDQANLHKLLIFKSLFSVGASINI